MLNPLYHLTDVRAAVKILQTKSFNLTMATSKSEIMFHKNKKKLFFLSTSRIAANMYREDAFSGSVTFVLNRDWFEQRYKAQPVDYWEGTWKTPTHNRSEKEERIFSDSPFLKMPTLSRAIHSLWIFFDVNGIDGRYVIHTRQLLILAKRNNIPVLYFTDRKAYSRGNARKTTELRQLIAKLEAQKERPPTFSSGSFRDHTSPWRELFWKQKKKDLSKEADRLAYKLVYYSYNNDVLSSLDADLHNNKKRIFEMRKMALIWKKLKISTVKEYYNFLLEKWKAIYAAEKG